MSKADECVKVVVRVRPMSSDEERNGNLIAVEAYPDTGLITVKNPKATEGEPPKNFTFDAVFGPNVEQKHIYNICASDVVESVLNGYNGTIFAYGQTGSGKTHTMEGRPDPPTLRGIIPNSFQHIFDYISSAGDKQYLVRASYLEIYNEEIRDLLSKDPKYNLEIKENIDTGVYVKDLTSYVVKNISEIDHVMQSGKKNRSVGATLMNATSSRSHSIFTVVVECAETIGKETKIRVGKLNLVDLAGSERQSKTGATGERLKEATKINQSLSALGNVISALVDGKATYIPYRDSKLTRLLQNSLGGNAKTLMCANCGPADYNYDETLSTLRYANRAKNIKNKPRINEDPKDAMLREYQDEISRLRAQLEATQRGVIIDESGKEVRIHNAREEIVEKIIEREKIVEVRVDMTAEQLAEVQRKAEEEKQILLKQAQDDMKQLIHQQSRTAQERAELQQALEREARDKKVMEEQKQKLVNKLRSMEEKLIQGGEVMSKLGQQEQELRRVQQEAITRQKEQLRLAKELAEKEEANLQLEEHFNSLQEEVDVKTKKLKKLLTKYQAAVQENKDLQNEFQRERSEMVETISQMNRTIRLKETIIANFIPEEYVKILERRATYNEEDDSWIIQKMELSGNNYKASTRPISHPKLKRPETEFTRVKRQFDTSPRYRYENIINLDLDLPEKTTQEFEGPGMVSRVDEILKMDLDNQDDDDDYVEYGDLSYPNSNNYSAAGPSSSAYQHYPGENNNGDDEQVKPSRRTGGSSSSSSNNMTSGGNSGEKDRRSKSSSSSGVKKSPATSRSASRSDTYTDEESDMMSPDTRLNTMSNSGSGSGSGSVSKSKSSTRRRQQNDSYDEADQLSNNMNQMNMYDNPRSSHRK